MQRVLLLSLLPIFIVPRRSRSRHRHRHRLAFRNVLLDLDQGIVMVIAFTC
jgi:hypothetical protein